MEIIRRIATTVVPHPTDTLGIEKGHGLPHPQLRILARRPTWVK
jgi:hypothetical protein